MRALGSKLLVAAAMVLGTAFQAQALSLTPDTANCNIPSPTPCLLDFGDDNSGWSNPTNIPLLYKDNFGGVEEGDDWKALYQTDYNDASLPDSDATISYVGIPGAGINSNPVYAYIKDGNASPNWYVFDISGWNGEESIIFSRFFEKAVGKPGEPYGISLVAIYGGPASVPDGGSAAALLGSALLGLGLLRRRFGRG